MVFNNTLYHHGFVNIVRNNIKDIRMCFLHGLTYTSLMSALVVLWLLTFFLQFLGSGIIILKVRPWKN